MTNEEFKHWINGYFSLSDELFLNKDQVNIIQNHVNLVATIEKLNPDVCSFLNFLIGEISFNGWVCFAQARLRLNNKV